MAGINTDIYKPHSCQSASTSKARDNGVDITDILKWVAGKARIHLQNIIQKTL